MERLLTNAEKLTGKKYDVSNFADVTEAIHAVQTEMGITGTTSEEASSTIEGSVNTMKASWTNWLTELGKDNGDISGATQKLFDSFVTAAGNIIPRIGTILASLGTAIVTSLPGIVSQVQSYLGTALQGFDLGATLQGAWDSLVTWIQSVDWVGMLSNTMATIGAAFNSIDWSALTTSLLTNIGNLLSSIDWPGLLGTVASGIIGAASSILSALGQIISSILSYLQANWQTILATVLSCLASVVSSIVSQAPSFLSAAVGLQQSILSGLSSLGSSLLSAVGSAVSGAASAIAGYASQFISAGQQLVQGIVNGIGDGASWVISKVQEVCGNALGALKSFFGIASPSKVMASMGGYMMQGWAKGIDGSGKLVARAMGGVSSMALDSVSGINSTLALAASGGGSYSMDVSGGGIVGAITDGIAQMGFYINDTRMATATREARDVVDGRVTRMANRGVDL